MVMYIEYISGRVHLIWPLVFCELIFFLLNKKHRWAFIGWEPADTQLSRIKADLFFGHLGTADQTVTTTLTFIFSSYKVDTTQTAAYLRVQQMEPH